MKYGPNSYAVRSIPCECHEMSEPKRIDLHLQEFRGHQPDLSRTWREDVAMMKTREKNVKDEDLLVW